MLKVLIASLVMLASIVPSFANTKIFQIDFDRGGGEVYTARGSISLTALADPLGGATLFRITDISGSVRYEYEGATENVWAITGLNAFGSNVLDGADNFVAFDGVDAGLGFDIDGGPGYMGFAPGARLPVVLGEIAGDGRLTLTSASAAAVPEPATWAMMIFGFGIVGYAMRRRRGAVGIRATFA